ncbi:Pre-mRNA splicing Prp18-interacting factor-domain-containing protein [Fimicolochytrium jonesii]|uniref:Pre-mRNA splicing Prp18-interacting factor-domain-containing protein n=1 Tax=Fimicolochytrium jonesii TaxID=1396493 RepID=UPI0022FE8894|nr:Pre-mRNA splicing Prp18-interacting factor-domain-containing protein [Fimicolochytrium jonesii]KAI8820218.1 Pre-mRNA splicing Prp18-interacting factor-domain-containing protein [Fimicolochytrium jonesii]
MATAQSQKLSREDFKRQKVIEEQRKAGTLPAEVDPETGRDINPHIPHYISQAPWYLDINHPTLKHQKYHPKEEGAINDWYARGARAGPAATKYRKGACENCGALSHKTRDCVERPRKTGAKWSGKDIHADELVQDVHLGFEAKRDRWNGYDPTEHIKLAEEWDLVEEERRKLREQQVKEKEKLMAEGKISVPEKEQEGKEKEAVAAGPADSDDSDDDEEKYADRADMPGQKLDTKTRTTVRNLRIREDTAKYLLNLDVNSAYYDPKTRSMRDNPVEDADPRDLTYAGDNFLRWTGDAPKLGQLQAFAWQAEERGKPVHMQSNPTQAALLYQEYQSKKGAVSEKVKNSILERYGGAEHLAAPPKELLLAQSENYVEYSQTGRVIKGQERAAAKSKYEEDVHPLNHTTVWGSWWKSGQWGYACCHNTIVGAYCTGAAGIEAARASVAQLTGGAAANEDQEASAPKSLLEQYVARAAKEGPNGMQAQDRLDRAKQQKGRGERLGEGEVSLDEAKLSEALDAERKRKAREALGKDREEDEGRTRSAKKGKYSSNVEVKDVTEEELEAYRLSRSNAADPMANYVDRDD